MGETLTRLEALSLCLEAPKCLLRSCEEEERRWFESGPLVWPESGNDREKQEKYV